MKYRPDIDGLRAVAVITIMFFHFGIPGFGGAFSGPEVFFVLSGYLIASRIFYQVEKGTFSFSDFYYKRIRRLFPAYLLMVLCTVVAAWIWLLPADFREFSKSFFASTVYMSNLQFYRESGYFDTASHLKPLLHTWSLSVEEQFYLFFPVTVAVLAWMSRRQFFFAFLAISAVSFIAAVIVIEQDKSLVFYMFPFRIWELGLGIMIATGCYVLPKFRQAWVNEGLAVLGLALILVPMFVYAPTMKFPGLAAVPACVGTWLIIQLDGERSTLVQRFLALKPMAIVGTLSYSLYLWHWPIYVFYAYTDTNGVDAAEMSALMVVILIASYLTYHYVEDPMRRGANLFVRTPKAVYLSAGVSTAVLMVMALTIFVRDGMPDRFDPKTREAIAATSLFGEMGRDCTELAQSRLEDMAYCEVGAPFEAERYTLIWGDSHSPTYRAGLASAAGPDVDALIVWSGGCPALFDAEVDELVASAADEAACARRNAAVRRLVETDRRIDSVIILGRWSYYGRGTGLGVDSTNAIKVWPAGQGPVAPGDQYAVYMDLFEHTVSVLEQAGVKVFVIEQPPEFPEFNARKFVLDTLTGKMSEDEIAGMVTIPYSLVEERQGPMMKLLARLEREGRITLLPTHRQMCGEAACSLLRDGAPLYFDNNHLATAMVPGIAEMFDPYLRFRNRM